MTITFQHPPRPANPLVHFDPSDITQYPDGPGVYIYGIRAKVGGNLKFIPLYVGKSETKLGERIFQHYYQGRMPGNSCKEIFDLANLKTLKDVQNLYISMREYDSGRGKTLKRIRNKELIWFNDKDFFNTYFSDKTSRTISTSQYISGSGHLASLYPSCGDLDLMSLDKSISNHVKDLKKKIIDTKELFNADFYFVYANVPKNGLHRISLYENSTKAAFKKIGLSTTADAKKEVLDIDVDLTQVENQLVNVEGHPYNVEGNYKNLIIPIRK